MTAGVRGMCRCVTTAVERKTLNEGRFREANERLDEGARDLLRGEETTPVPFLCECPNPRCMAVVLATLEEYEAVRARGAFGLAAIGHEDPEIERVVARNDRFLTTEKVGRAGEVHRQTDPRQ